MRAWQWIKEHAKWLLGALGGLVGVAAWYKIKGLRRKRVIDPTEAADATARVEAQERQEAARSLEKDLGVSLDHLEAQRAATELTEAAETPKAVEALAEDNISLAEHMRRQGRGDD